MNKYLEKIAHNLTPERILNGGANFVIRNRAALAAGGAGFALGRVTKRTNKSKTSEPQ